MLGLGLYKSAAVAIMRCYSPADTLMERHDHKETEYTIVIAGEIVVSETGKEDFTLKPGDNVKIEPNTPHSFFYKKDTISISLSIPASPEYANG
jgi:quercetin dioxygenase-like cupin family protein